MKSVRLCHTREMGPFDITFHSSHGFKVTMEGVGTSYYGTYADLVESMDTVPTPEQERALMALTEECQIDLFYPNVGTSIVGIVAP